MTRGFGSKSPFSYKFPPMSHVKRRKTDEDEETAEDTQMTPHTPQKKDKEGDEKEEKAASEEAKGTTKTVHPRQIWSTKMQTSAKALYEIAATPQKPTKEIREDKPAQESKRAVDSEMRDLFQKMQELNLQMKEELAKAKSSSSAPEAQFQERYEGLHTQIEKLTQITQRHEDEIEDLRVMVDYTHEIVLDKEARESSLKMIIKAWPKETTYYDRLRVTDWLIEKAAIKNQVTQEHGYYTSGKKIRAFPGVHPDLCQSRWPTMLREVLVHNILRKVAFVLLGLIGQLCTKLERRMASTCSNRLHQ